MSAGYRPLTDREQGVLRKMLAVEFPGHQSLEAQVSSLSIQKLDETLYCLAPLSTEPSETHRKTHGVPIEGVYRDKDDAIVFVWLFTDEHDALIELEVWKPDGSAVLTYFADADLLVRRVDTE